MLLAIECILVVIAVCLAIAFPRLGDRGFTFFERHFARLASRRLLSVVAVGMSALALRVALLPVLGIPEPAVHDEFSYLLAADTFAHGRLANPVHPMWTHFETFHEIQQPTYASMYYPAQGLFLALGQVVFRHPFWGVWFSTGLMCGAICWMLQAWLPPPWALLGGLIAVVRIGTFSYWMNSYWGGSVAALGGALVLGALPRIQQRQRARDSALMALGFALIATSRPYEGIFFAIPILILMAAWSIGKSAPPRRALAARVILPLSIVLLAAVAWMGYYFWRTTGSPFHTPFEINLRTYNSVPYFPWQQIKTPPIYRHRVMEGYYAHWWATQYQLGRNHPIVLLLLKMCSFWTFFLGPALSLPVAASSLLLPYGFSFRELNRRTKILLLIISTALFGSLLPVYFNPHYVAPITAAIYALILIGMQHLQRWRPKGRPVGNGIVRSTCVVLLLLLGLAIVSPALRGNRQLTLATWYSPCVTESYRSEIITRLSRAGGNHLVIVRYTPDHDARNEWVFNDADIDNSKVVWARDMADKNQELIHYFSARTVWIVEPDELPPALSHYPIAGSAAAQTSNPVAESGNASVLASVDADGGHR